MLTFNCYTEEEGIPIAKVIGAKKNNLLCLSKKESSTGFKNLELNKLNFETRLNPYQRSVVYIAGPSGSGKTTYAVNLIKPYLVLNPEMPFFLFSRTDYKLDPAFAKLKPMQIPIDESLLKNPIDITTELTEGAIVLFDDCNTIHDDKIRKEIEKLMADILEIGRKLNITIIVTSHLVIPNSKKFARTIMNECQQVTVFPQSGSSQQIRYALKTYFGLDNKQIDKIIKTKSRWITISKNFPMYVLSDKSVYIL